MNPEDLARLFHETYERLAPSHGYETRKASAVPWEDVPEANKSLMIAVAAEVGQAHERQVRERVATESAVLAPADLAEILDYIAGRGDVRVVRTETLDRAFAALKATLPGGEAR